MSKVSEHQMGRTWLRVYDNKGRLILKKYLKMSHPKTQGYANAQAQAEVNTRATDPVPQEKEEITTYRDNDQIVAQKRGLYSHTTLRVPSDPYEEQYIQTLKRNYPVDVFSWTGSQATGTQVFNLQFPEALVLKPFISDVLKRFRYFRAGVKITVRINSTNFNSGSLLICWLPHYNSQGALYADRRQNIFQASAQPCSLVSANQREVVEITIPWIQPRRYWDMDHELVTLPQYQGLIGSVTCFVQTPLKSNATTSVPSVDVSVFANFYDIEIAGMKVYEAQSSVRTSKSKSSSSARTKGSPMEKEAEEKSGTRLLSTACDVVGNIAGLFEESPYGEEAIIVESVAKIASAVFSNLGYSKTTDRQEKTRIVPYVSGTFNLASGIDLAEKMSLYGENSITKDFTEFGTDKDYDVVSNLIGIPSLALTQSFDANSAPGDLLYAVGVHPRLSDCTDYQGYTRLMAQYTQFWTGAMKFSLRLYTSSFITTRIRVCWFPHVPPLTLSDDVAGDIISQVLDINGDTILDFTIPYLHQKTHLLNRILDTDLPATKLTDCLNGYIAAYVVNKVVSSQPDASTYIGIALWASGGDDMRFAGLRGGRSSLDNGPPLWQAAEAQAAVQSQDDLQPRQAFQKVFGALSPAMCQIQVGPTMGEHISRVSDLVTHYRHFATMTILNNEAGTLANPFRMFLEDYVPTGFTFQTPGVWDIQQILNTFLFHKGSTRFKIVPSSHTDAVQITTTMFPHDTPCPSGYQNFSVGGVVPTNDNKRIPEIEVPYYHNEYFVSNGIDFPPLFNIPIPQVYNEDADNETSSAYLRWFFALGEDYTMGFPASILPLLPYDNSSRT